MIALSKDDLALEVAQSHASSNEGIQAVYRLVGPNEKDEKEPLKLLEVDEYTVERGIEPLIFPADPPSGRWCPLVLVDVSPREFEHILGNRMPLPHGWTLGDKLAG